MDMNCHPRDTKLHQIKKVIKRVEEFTEGGKRCFARLKEQIELRLPAATASQSLATLLDPATKKFAKQLLTESIYEETVDLLWKEHRKFLKAMNTEITEAEVVVATGMENAVPAEEDILEEPRQMDNSDDDELNSVSVVSLKKDKKTLAAEEELKSDAMFKDWQLGHWKEYQLKIMFNHAK